MFHYAEFKLYICSSHRINESVLDEQIYKQLAIMRDGLSKCSRQIESDIRSWMAQKNNVSKRIKRLQDSINATELEVEQILMEKGIMPKDMNE